MKDQFEQSMFRNECPNPINKPKKTLTKEQIKEEIEFIICNSTIILNI